MWLLLILIVTGCWTITAGGTLSFMRSCRSRLQWQQVMCTLSGECWSKDTRLRSAMPMAGHCSTSLLPKEKRDVFESFWSMEVRGFVLFVMLLKLALSGGWHHAMTSFSVHTLEGVTLLEKTNFHSLLCWKPFRVKKKKRYNKSQTESSSGRELGPFYIHTTVIEISIEIFICFLNNIAFTLKSFLIYTKHFDTITGKKTKEHVRDCCWAPKFPTI